MKNTVPVTLQCLPARTTSRAQYGCGYQLNYGIPTSVHAPGYKPLLLPKQAQRKNAIPGARSVAQLVPLGMAATERLLTFVRACYIHDHLGFDCHSFAQYIMGAIAAPNEQRELEANGTPVDVRRPLEVGRVYVATRNKVVVHAFLAISKRTTLSVGGVNAGLCVIELKDLLCAYGCNGLMQVSRYVA